MGRGAHDSGAGGRRSLRRACGTRDARVPRALGGAGYSGPAPTLLPNDARIRYQLMSTVPEHWIPFIPVHVGTSQRAIQLQRASVPRAIPGDPMSPAPVRPRTELACEGPPQDNRIFCRTKRCLAAGHACLQFFRRARWHDGGVHVWLAARRESGRGEGSSGLVLRPDRSLRSRR